MLAFFVGLGGFIGAVLRYGLHAHTFNFLYPTAIINLLGSFLMGGFLSIGRENFGEVWYHFLITGILGGFTTYSAFSGETYLLIKNSQFSSAFLYCSLTFFGGLLMTFLGFFLVSSVSAFMKSL